MDKQQPTMTDEQAAWIVNTLCPFILREEGRGFAMSDFVVRGRYIDGSFLDGIEPRTPPSCNTVACICGSIARLRGPSCRTSALVTNGAAIGLDSKAAEGLFLYYGTGADDQARKFHWPLRFARRHEDAKTPLAKAKVAVA